MIEINSLFCGYQKEIVLKNLSLCCNTGEITTIIGPNGCGKSTLLKAITGILPVKSGDIKINGTSLCDLSHQKRAQKIAYLSQGKNIPDITALRMVLHGRFPYLSYPRKYSSSDYDLARQAMDKMGILSLGEKRLEELSGGMRQKVYIAMALCQGADVILLDEPATYLDISQQIKTDLICKELSEEGKTIICVSHDIISAVKNSHKIAVMDKGEIIMNDTPEKIIESEVIKKVFNVRVMPVVVNDTKEFYYKNI